MIRELSDQRVLNYHMWNSIYYSAYRQLCDNVGWETWSNTPSNSPKVPEIMLLASEVLNDTAT